MPETQEKGIRVPSVPETQEKGIRVTVPETQEKGIRDAKEGNGNIVERLRRRPEYLFLYKHIPWT